ncbi:MAG: helix-turn-helix domain-containing protein [Clostridiales bacterium]|nr:helix-turn-helix domain-containing protein [Clostridiales bacterium]
MSKKIETNQKHMNQDNRVVIEKRLYTSTPLSAIAAELGKDPTTISKEIKKHRSFQKHNVFNETAFRCAIAKDCHRKNVCNTELFCKRECKRCNKCITFARTISHSITLVLKLRKLHMFVMVVLRKADAGLISINTAPLGHKRNIKLS